MAILFKIEHPEEGSSTTMAANNRDQALKMAINWLGGEFTILDENNLTLTEYTERELG